MLLSIALLAVPIAAPPAAVAGAASVTVAAVIERGQLLYAYDREAWLGTDDALVTLRAAGLIGELEKEGGSWIVEGPVETPRITFFANWDTPRAVYVAQFAADGTRLMTSEVIARDAAALTAAQLRLIAAIKVARAEAAARKLHV